MRNLARRYDSNFSEYKTGLLMPRDARNKPASVQSRARIADGCQMKCGHAMINVDHANSRKVPRVVARFSCCAARSNKNISRRLVISSGWWDLNPRPPGPEPGA